MKAEFLTPVFDVRIEDLADFLGIDGMAGPDYKIDRTKKLVWDMTFHPTPSYFGGIDFKVTQVQFNFSWSVTLEYLEEYEVLKLQKEFETYVNKDEIFGQFVIDATEANGWKLDFERFDLQKGCGFEYSPDEIEVNLSEKTILVR